MLGARLFGEENSNVQTTMFDAGYLCNLHGIIFIRHTKITRHRLCALHVSSGVPGLGHRGSPRGRISPERDPKHNFNVDTEYLVAVYNDVDAFDVHARFLLRSPTYSSTYILSEYTNPSAHLSNMLYTFFIAGNSNAPKDARSLADSGVKHNYASDAQRWYDEYFELFII